MKYFDNQSVPRVGRRAFCLGTAAVAAGGCRSLLSGDGRDYSVSVFGDMHYDAAPREKFHSAFLKVWGENRLEDWRLKEFDRNAAMWQGVGRRILAAAGDCATSDTAFALQLGDLVQGDCRDETTHRALLQEAAGALSDVFGGRLPVVTVCGNHDVRLGTTHDGSDRDAAVAYRDFSRDWHGRQLARLGAEAPQETTFAFRQGPDLFVVVDFNFPSADRVKALLAANEDVRYTFVVSHGPLAPMDLWPRRWFLYGDEPDDGIRGEMRALFARRNAIVLAGHVHSLELKDFVLPEGRITEMVMNTIVRRTGKTPVAEPEVLATDPARYGLQSPKAAEVEGLPGLFGAWRPYLRRYFLSRAAGHHRLRVSDAGVWLDYYGLDARIPTRTFVIRSS